MLTSWIRKAKLRIQRRKQNIPRLRHIGKPAFISATASFAFQENISIDRYCRIGKENRIDGEGGLTIGTGTVLAPRVVILTSSHNYKQDKLLPYDNTDVKAGVTIGRGVWIGWGAIILPGVSIGDGAVIAAGSVVSKPVEKGQIVAGNPARVIRVRENVESIDELVSKNEYFLKYAFDGGESRSGRQPYDSEVIR